MPIDLVTVERVQSMPTTKAGITSYLVTATTIEDHPRTLCFETINEWNASLCHQAVKAHSQLWITWKSNQFRSKDITKVEPDQTALRFK